jgi:hypothetical protein
MQGFKWGFPHCLRGPLGRSPTPPPPRTGIREESRCGGRSSPGAKASPARSSPVALLLPPSSISKLAEEQKLWRAREASWDADARRGERGRRCACRPLPPPRTGIGEQRGETAGSDGGARRAVGGGTSKTPAAAGQAWLAPPNCNVSWRQQQLPIHFYPVDERQSWICLSKLQCLVGLSLMGCMSCLYFCLYAHFEIL